MRKFFQADSPLMRTLNTMADLMILNLLTLLCSIPIVTIGAAVTALYDALWKLDNDEGRLTRNYFAAFKSNFKKATLLWLIFLPLGIVIFLNFISVFTADTSLLGTIFSLFAFVWWAFAVAWAFPLQSRFENTVWGTFKNSILFPLGYFPRTLGMATLNMLPWIMLMEPGFHYYLALVGPVWFLLYFALAAFLNLKLLAKPFDRFFAQAAVEEYYEQQSET